MHDDNIAAILSEFNAPEDRAMALRALAAKLLDAIDAEIVAERDREDHAPLWLELAAQARLRAGELLGRIHD